MERRIFVVLFSGLVVLGTAVPVPAHHSFAAEYDLNQPVTVQGVIVQVKLENPHSWFLIDVKDSTGKVERWSFEAGTPSGMIRNGFRQDTIKPGAEVTIKGFRAKDAENRGMLRQVTTADGHVYGMFGPQETK